jgi:hypothetical protein
MDKDFKAKKILTQRKHLNGWLSLKPELLRE